MNHRDEIDSIGDRIAEHAAHLDAATHRLLTDLRAFDQAGGWAQQSFRSFGQWLAWRVGWDPITAREHVRVANKLGSLPLIDDALRRGELSYSKVRAMTRVATSANEVMLLEQARYSTGAQLERICKQYAAVQRHDEEAQPADDQQRRHLKRSDTADGMVKIEAILHPEEAALVWAALERIAAERCRERSAETPLAPRVPASAESSAAVSSDITIVESASSLAGDSAKSWTAIDLADARRAKRVTPFDRVDALVSLAQHVLRGTSKERAPTDLVITVTAETLTKNADAADLGVIGDGTCVSAIAARRLACDCGVTEVVEDESGAALSIGRKRRTIPGSMKRALLRRDHTCRFPGCTARVFLEGHHIEHWADGGDTALENIVSLCGLHHRYVHEYGFRIMGRGGDLLFVDPRGRIVRDVPERPVVCDSGWPAILAANANLAITSETLAHEWDGNRVDYPRCVDALLAVDQNLRKAATNGADFAKSS